MKWLWWLLLLPIWLAIETLWVRVTRVQVPARARLRVVQISDIHGRTRFLNGRVSRFVNRLHPDVVCVTGDLTSHLYDLPRVLAELRRIECPHMYFVPGNWERETLGERGKRELSEAEVDALLEAVSKVARLLLNAGEVIEVGGAQVLLYGFDNSRYGRELYRPPPDVDMADVRILLAHSPRIAAGLERDHIPFDLLLTGHTHGGQVSVFGRRFGDYRDVHVGGKRLASGVFIVSRGLGTVRFPLRLGSLPEIVWCDLRSYIDR